MSDLVNLSPVAAYKYLQDNAETSVLIDIRSSMEYLFVGHPTGAVHIAWIDEPDWEINPDFCNEIKRTIESKCKNVAPTEASVLLCCRSGKRTLDAGDALLEAGFRHVLHIDEGFEGDRDDNNHRSTMGGWRFHGLPWEQC